MKINKIALLFFAVLLLTSCYKALYSVMTPQHPKVKSFELTRGATTKSIVFVGMVHVANPKFYKEAKEIVTNYKNDGYSVFYEGVKAPKNMDSLVLDTIERKFRKILGLPIPNYKKKENIPQFLKSGNYISETPQNTGYNVEEDFNADLNVAQIVKKYETKFGTIKLDSCDLATSLKNGYYNCNDLPHRKYALMTIRNENVIKSILDSSKNKILLIYGYRHYKPLKEKLLALDAKEL